MDKQVEKALHKGIKENNVKDVLELLVTVKDVNHFHKGAEPLLSAAIASGNKVIIEALLNKNANPRQTNPSGHKALHVAAKNGRVDIMDLLLKAGEEITLKTDTGDSALYVAVANEQVRAVEYLIEHGANVNSTGSYLHSRNTPLHEAAKSEDVTILNLLLAANANVNVQNDNKQTPLHIAATEGRAECTERLLRCGARVDDVELSGSTALQLACNNGHGNVIRKLCTAGASFKHEDKKEEDCFRTAVSNRHVHVVKMLLHFGADVNRIFSNRRTALHMAVDLCPHSMQIKWTQGSNKLSVNAEIEMFDTLLQGGADLNKRDMEGETPLHLCVRHGCAAALEYFIKQGADTCTINESEETPLITACMENVTPAIALLLRHCPSLVNHPANRNHSSTDYSPLLLLYRKSNLDCLRVLLAAGYRATEAERSAILLKQADLEEDAAGTGTTSHRGRGGFRAGFGGGFRGGFRGAPRRGRGRGGAAVHGGKKKESQAMKDMLEEEFSNPWTLERISTTFIRETLGEQLLKKVADLPVPWKLRHLLMLENALYL